MESSGVAEAGVDDEDDDDVDPEVELVSDADPYEDAKMLVLDKEGDVEIAELELDIIADPDTEVIGVPPFDKNEDAVVEDGRALDTDEP